MFENYYAAPILVGASDGSATRLERLPLGGGSDYDEGYIQKLVFQHPEALPIAEIDRAYEGLIPVCMELNTPAGPLDVMYVTPAGRLVVVEAKLWRNPEARRKVVGQILDYAKELAHWQYEDLQREVSRKIGLKGNVLYELVRKYNASVDEATFVDEVTRSLRQGRFLLLVVGDGIREGVGAIADFMNLAGHLAFTFGLVEVGLYRANNLGTLVQPRVLAKTVVIKRTVLTLQDGHLETKEEDETEAQQADREPTEQERFYLGFWPEFMADLQLDDVTQTLPIAEGRRISNMYFPMPPGGGDQVWIAAGFSPANQEVRVLLTFVRGALADTLYQALSAQRAEIDVELGLDVQWEEASDGKYKISCRRTFPDLRDPACREPIKSFLRDAINRYVNVFRPRLTKLAEEL